MVLQIISARVFSKEITKSTKLKNTTVSFCCGEFETHRYSISLVTFASFVVNLVLLRASSQLLRFLKQAIDLA
jgi:hypothetical protein